MCAGQEVVRRYHVAIGEPESRAEEISKRYGGHSGRVGLIVAAKESGASDTSIAAVSRHTTLKMVKRYG